MDDSVVIRPAYRGEVASEDLEALADRLRRDGLQARVGESATEILRSPPIPFVEIVCIWVAQGAAMAVGEEAARSAIKWAREQFRKNRDEGEFIRVIEIVRDKGKDQEGTVVRALALRGAAAEPEAVSPEDYDEDDFEDDFDELTRLKDFEDWTRSK